MDTTMDITMDKTMDNEFDLAKTQEAIEAILFAAGHPVTYEKIADILSLTPTKVKETLKHYEYIYNSTDLPRGVQLILFDSACQLCTKSEYEQQVKLALGIRQGKGNLSNTSLEVLAIVAYHQPVTRAYIEQVRGVDSSYAIAILIEKNLIEKKGRLDVPGRPSLYGTTIDFLRCFGLTSLEQLPPIEMLDLSLGEDEQSDKVSASETESVSAENTPDAESIQTEE